MNLNDKITFEETVFAQEVDGEMVLLDMESENYFGLDAMGTVFWHEIQEKETLKDVLDALLEKYEVESDILEKDLIGFVEKLKESGLVEEV